MKRIIHIISVFFTTVFVHSSYTLKQKRTLGYEFSNSQRNTGHFEFRECCASHTQAIAPLGGLSREGALLQLFRDPTTVQKFYETSCAPGIQDRPCRYINETYRFSRCEQKYTYTYAIVKDFNVTQPYRIDYIKIKSGCSCIVGEPTLDIL